MKLSELMKDISPDAKYEGFATSDDFLLAIDVSEEQNSEIGNYAVVQTGISGIEPALKTEIKENRYIRSGLSGIKTSAQRQFRISGDRYAGDEAQDFLLSHRLKYGTGQTSVINYVFFNMLTGKGEKGKVSVSVNSDGGGKAGENAGIDIQLFKIGAAPEEYTYSAGT